VFLLFVNRRAAVCHVSRIQTKLNLQVRPNWRVAGDQTTEPQRARKGQGKTRRAQESQWEAMGASGGQGVEKVVPYCREYQLAGRQMRPSSSPPSGPPPSESSPSASSSSASSPWLGPGPWTLGLGPWPWPRPWPWPWPRPWPWPWPWALALGLGLGFLARGRLCGCSQPPQQPPSKCPAMKGIRGKAVVRLLVFIKRH
jgi:hypothetical protein